MLRNRVVCLALVAGCAGCGVDDQSSTAAVELTQIARPADAALRVAISTALDSVGPSLNGTGLIPLVVHGSADHPETVMMIHSMADVDQRLSAVLAEMAAERGVTVCDVQIPFFYRCAGHPEIEGVFSFGAPMRTGDGLIVPVMIAAQAAWWGEGWSAYTTLVDPVTLSLLEWQRIGGGH